MKNNIIWNNWETFRANSKKPTLMVEYFCSSKGLWKTSTIFGSLPQIGLISWVTFRVNPKTLKMASKYPKISYFYMTYLKSKKKIHSDFGCLEGGVMNTPPQPLNVYFQPHHK